MTREHLKKFIEEGMGPASPGPDKTRQCLHCRMFSDRFSQTHLPDCPVGQALLKYDELEPSRG